MSSRDALPLFVLLSAGRPLLSKEEALEMFLKEHQSQESIRDNKNLLKQRFAATEGSSGPPKVTGQRSDKVPRRHLYLFRASEARRLEERLKESREAISESTTINIP